jgi:hypothetical protein
MKQSERRMLSLFFVFIFTLTLTTFGLSLATEAATFYVDNSVSSNGVGTKAAPWKNASNIVWSSITAGDTILLSGGISSQKYSEPLKIGKSGSLNANITIKRPTPGEWENHSGVVYIRPTSGDAIEISTNRYITIDGLDFSSADASSRGNGIVITGSNVVIRNCTSQNNKGFAVAGGNNSSYVTVQNNILGPNSLTSGDDPIQIGPVNNWTIESNHIYGGWSTAGQHFDGIQLNEPCNNIKIRYNLFNEQNTGAISVFTAWNHTNIEIYGNVFNYSQDHGQGENGIAIYWGGGYNDGYATGKIYNNTFINWDNRGGAGIWLNSPHVSSFVDIKNNVFWNSHLYKTGGADSTITLDYNSYYAPETNRIIEWGSGAFFSSIPSFNNAVGKEQHGKDTNPNLARVTTIPSNNLDPMLTSASLACIGQATPITGYNTRLSISSVLNSWTSSVSIVEFSPNDSLDIGAYAFSAAGGGNIVPSPPKGLKALGQ